LTLALDGSEWSVSRLGRFILREIVPHTHGIGSWVGHGTGLDAVVKRKIPSPSRESNPRTPIIQLVAQCYTTELYMFIITNETSSDKKKYFVPVLQDIESTDLVNRV
jgi:hypothetical protein